MRIVVIGANGTTGQEIVTQAQAEGYDVVCCVRRPNTLAHLQGVEIVKIDLSNIESLTRAMKGADIVVSALGHGGIRAAMKSTTLYSDATRNIRTAMRKASVKRILVLSSGGTVDNDKAPAFYTKFLRRLLINTYTDMARMETILEETQDLEWTSVRLTYLRKGPSKPFLVEEGKLSRGNFQIHYADVGKFIVNEFSAKQWINAHPVLGYDK